MFYVKTQLSDVVAVIADITDDNVFTRCPSCGGEVAVDIADIFSDGKGDLVATAVYCADCSKLRRHNHDNFDMPITFDGLSWLTGILRNAGYSELIDELFLKYGIKSLCNLPEERYQEFGNALVVVTHSAVED